MIRAELRFDTIYSQSERASHDCSIADQDVESPVTKDLGDLYRSRADRSLRGKVTIYELHIDAGILLVNVLDYCCNL